MSACSERAWDDERVVDLIFFTASWAERICGPYRSVVSDVATRMGVGLVELDCDIEPDEARRYGLLNVPAVALSGDIRGVVVGAVDGRRLEEELRERLDHRE